MFNCYYALFDFFFLAFHAADLATNILVMYEYFPNSKLAFGWMIAFHGIYCIACTGQYTLIQKAHYATMQVNAKVNRKLTKSERNDWCFVDFRVPIGFIHLPDNILVMGLFNLMLSPIIPFLQYFFCVVSPSWRMTSHKEIFQAGLASANWNQLFWTMRRLVPNGDKEKDDIVKEATDTLKQPQKTRRTRRVKPTSFASIGNHDTPSSTDDENESDEKKQEKKDESDNIHIPNDEQKPSAAAASSVTTTAVGGGLFLPTTTTTTTTTTTNNNNNILAAVTDDDDDGEIEEENAEQRDARVTQEAVESVRHNAAVIFASMNKSASVFDPVGAATKSVLNQWSYSLAGSLDRYISERKSSYFLSFLSRGWFIGFPCTLTQILTLTLVSTGASSEPSKIQVISLVLSIWSMLMPQFFHLKRSFTLSAHFSKFFMVASDFFRTAFIYLALLSFAVVENDALFLGIEGAWLNSMIYAWVMTKMVLLGFACLSVVFFAIRIYRDASNIIVAICQWILLIIMGAVMWPIMVMVQEVLIFSYFVAPEISSGSFLPYAHVLHEFLQGATESTKIDGKNKIMENIDWSRTFDKFVEYCEDIWRRKKLYAKKKDGDANNNNNNNAIISAMAVVDDLTDETPEDRAKQCEKDRHQNAVKLRKEVLELKNASTEDILKKFQVLWNKDEEEENKKMLVLLSNNSTDFRIPIGESPVEMIDQQQHQNDAKNKNENEKSNESSTQIPPLRPDSYETRFRHLTLVSVLTGLIEMEQFLSDDGIGVKYTKTWMARFRSLIDFGGIDPKTGKFVQGITMADFAKERVDVFKLIEEERIKKEKEEEDARNKNDITNGSHSALREQEIVTTPDDERNHHSISIPSAAPTTNTDDTNNNAAVASDANNNNNSYGSVADTTAPTTAKTTISTVSTPPPPQDESLCSKIWITLRDRPEEVGTYIFIGPLFLHSAFAFLFPFVYAGLYFSQFTLAMYIVWGFAIGSLAISALLANHFVHYTSTCNRMFFLNFVVSPKKAENLFSLVDSYTSFFPLTVLQELVNFNNRKTTERKKSGGDEEKNEKHEGGYEIKNDEHNPRTPFLDRSTQEHETFSRTSAAPTCKIPTDAFAKHVVCFLDSRMVGLYGLEVMEYTNIQKSL